MVLFDNIEDLFQNVRDTGSEGKALISLATIFGAIFFIILSIKTFYSLLIGFRLYILNQYCSRTDFVKKYGKWALVTGSTDGIGLALSKELARRGHSLIIIGRNEQKLANSKVSIEAEQTDGEVVAIKIDLSDSSEHNYASIKGQIDAENRDIGILINNAGTFPGYFKPFAQYDDKDTRDIVNVNILATVFFTKMILPGMLNRRKGLIVNISSLISYSVGGFNNAYGPTKSFVNAFSEMLQNELSSYPIDVVNLTLGGVVTKLYAAAVRYSKPNCISPSADDYARSAINAIATPLSTMSGSLTHGLQCKMILLLRSVGASFYIFKLVMTLGANNFQSKQVVEQDETLLNRDGATN